MKTKIEQCVSRRRCLEILTEEIQDHLPQKDWIKYEHAVNTVVKEFDRYSGSKPNFNKGINIPDYYTCSNCGKKIYINENFCPNCGHELLWGDPRYSTGKEKKNEKK